MCTATVTSRGFKICKRYNDNRGCVGPCINSLVHACDALLAYNDQVCGDTRHNREGHDEARHGKVKRF